MTPIRVLVADDHPFFRNGLKTLLESAPDTEFAGEAETGGQAIAMAEDLQPDVILMDVLFQRNDHPKFVQELLGHASVAITLDTYSQMLPGMGDQTVTAI